MFGPAVKNGFDIVIGNPPYIKEYTYKSAFEGVRESPYYMGKMDIWYMFTCRGMDFLITSGNLCFIAQNNWVTSYGAKKMREKILDDSQILQMIDFGDYKIFENAGIQTMIMIFNKNKAKDEYNFEYRKLIGNENNFNDVLNLLNKCKTDYSEYINPRFSRKLLKGKTFTFSNSTIENILNKIKVQSNFSLMGTEVTNGIHPHHPYVTKSMLRFLGENHNIGEGIFALNINEIKEKEFSAEEMRLIKPYYSNSKLINKYNVDNHNEEWIIYTTSEFKHSRAIKPYPKIKEHLDNFKNVITSDNKPYGLHRSREERFFLGEKVISLRKCSVPLFAYSELVNYFSAAFYIIKSSRINLKYLTALLNSSLLFFWLKYKGKMQGNIFQIDKEPLLEIPIYKSDKPEPLIILVDKILSAKHQNPQADTKHLEDKIDIMVYKLYELTYEEVKIIDPKIEKIISEDEYGE